MNGRSVGAASISVHKAAQGGGTTEDSVTAEQLFLGGAPVTPLVAITPPGFLRDSYTINGFHGGATIGYNL